MSEPTRFARYWADPVTRAEIKARRRARYQPRPCQSAPPRPFCPRGPNAPKQLDTPNGPVTLLSAGDAAQRYQVTKVTLRAYETKGVIPPHLPDGRGRRWYPQPLVELLAPVFQGQALARLPAWKLKAQVEEILSKHPQPDLPPIPHTEESHDRPDESDDLRADDDHGLQDGEDQEQPDDPC